MSSISQYRGYTGSPVFLTLRQPQDGFCKSFRIVLRDGEEVIPFRVRNRETGHSAFLVSKGGNTRDDAIEVADEALGREHRASNRRQQRFVTFTLHGLG